MISFGEPGRVVWDCVRKHATTALEGDLSDERNLLEEGILDSIGIVGLTIDLQEKFGIRFEAGELNPSNFASVAAIVQLIGEKRGEPGGTSAQPK